MRLIGLYLNRYTLDESLKCELYITWNIEFNLVTLQIQFLMNNNIRMKLFCGEAELRFQAYGLIWDANRFKLLRLKKW